MSAKTAYLAMLFDPRGRCDRGGLLRVAIALLVVQAVAGLAVATGLMGLDSPLLMAMKVLFVWIATAASIKRLHDVGRSGWWLLWALMAIIAWSVVASIAGLYLFGREVLVMGSGPFMSYAVATTVPVLAGALWLHVAKGDAGANRYGPEPGEYGFAGPHRQQTGALAAA